MTSTLRLSFMASASLIAIAGAAQAQSTADLFDLGEIVLEGEYDPSDPVPGYVATTAQTATKTGTPILETPQSISVITGEQIEDQGATTLGDTLGYTSGLLAQPYGTDPRFDAPTIRGFDGSNAQYLNGLRLLRDFGAPAFEIYSLERVEVLKGPASVLYGAGIPGGVINQIQKRAQFLSFGEVGVGLGDPKATEGFIDYNHAFSDTFAARVTAVARDSEEDVEDLENSRKYLGLATRWEPTEGTSLQFLGSWLKDSPITPAGVPYDLIGDADDEDLREFYAGDRSDDESERETLNLGFELNQELSANWDLDVNFRYQKFDWDYTGFYVNNGVTGGDTITRGANITSEDSFTQNLDARITGTVDTGPVAHTLLFGMDLRRYGIKESTGFAYADDISFSNPSYNGANLSDAWYVETNDLTLEQFGIYAQDEMAFGNWRASLALRHDWASQEGTNWNNFGGATEIDQDDEATTGRAGLSYVFANGVAPYVSYATSFDPEIGADNSGNTYEPTKGEQWELGVKYQPLGFNGFFSAAIYDLKQTNLLTATTDANGVGDYNQIGEARSQGLELEGSVDLDNGWNLRGAYSWNLAEQTEGDNEGNDLPNAPMHNASLWANYSFAPDTVLAGLTVGGGARYIGERYGDAANTYHMEDVTLLDLQAAYAITEDMQVSVNVSNLTDEAYVANCGSFGCYYGDGRTVQARLTYKW
ncbi:TonB-dependent receptor [Alloyangia pacifica]|uniref:TonB-dependent receptor n=1 Tax=Alloyangia pacifica TaxID=311180 RepID=UPI001CD1C959|nr:TonB-dependent siderophore receptor [Alloyangia pacifica]MCA0994927.1 TonB-dependent siderophore receptor [Alloyangia pacifica]